MAERCRIVFTSLPGPPEVRTVVGAEDGLLAGARADDVHVDLTTNSVSAARQLAELESARGLRFVDCPVSGGIRGAEAGSLALLASGDQTGYERCKPLLEAIGSNPFFLGEAGTGCLVKLVNNAIALCSSQLVTEGLVLAAKGGLDPAKLYEMLRASSACACPCR